MTAGDPFFAASHDAPADDKCGDPFIIAGGHYERELRFNLVYLSKNNFPKWISFELGYRHRNEFECYAINDNLTKKYAIFNNGEIARNVIQRLRKDDCTFKRDIWEKGQILESGKVIHDA